MSSATRRILILGAGTFAQAMADSISEIEETEVVGFVDIRGYRERDARIAGLPVLQVNDLGAMTGTHELIFGIGTTRRAGYLKQLEAYAFRFATLVHPTTYVAPTASVGEGTFVAEGVIVAPYSRIASHVTINRGATIGHHVRVGSFTMIGPGANIAGNMEIGAGVYVGIGATIIDHIAVGDDAVVGAGAVVVRDVASATQVVGVPARVVRTNIEGK